MGERCTDHEQDPDSSATDPAFAIASHYFKQRRNGDMRYPVGHEAHRRLLDIELAESLQRMEVRPEGSGNTNIVRLGAV